MKRCRGFLTNLETRGIFSFLVKVHYFVCMGIDARGVLVKLCEVCSMFTQEGVKVSLGLPVGVVNHAESICAFVQRRSHEARFVFYLFSKVAPAALAKRRGGMRLARAMLSLISSLLAKNAAS